MNEFIYHLIIDSSLDISVAEHHTVKILFNANTLNSSNI